MKKAQLVLFGGSFNPPTVSHVRIAVSLANAFPRVVVIPCGTHPFKEGTASVVPIHRIAMARLAFGYLTRNIELDLSDFERQEGRRTFERQAQYEDRGEIWHAIGSDLIVGAHEGRAEVQRWAQAERIWREYRWVIIERPGFAILEEDLPPNSRRFPEDSPAYSSTQVRERVRRGESIAEMVPGSVATYISAHRPYK